MGTILNLLNNDVGKQIISGVASSTGNDANKTSSVLTMALPVLMKAMGRNAATPEGASGLLSALYGKHNGSILDNLGSLFDGGVEESVKQDGAEILSNILGDKQQGVEQIIGQKSGLCADSVANILKVVAPILMGILGKKSRDNNVTDSSGLVGLLGGMLVENENEQNFLEKILDEDGDRSSIDDFAILKGAMKKSRFSSLLGGFFEK